MGRVFAQLRGRGIRDEVGGVWGRRASGFDADEVEDGLGAAGGISAWSEPVVEGKGIGWVRACHVDVEAASRR